MRTVCRVDRQCAQTGSPMQPQYRLYGLAPWNCKYFSQDLVMAPWGRIPVWDPKHVGVKETGSPMQPQYRLYGLAPWTCKYFSQDLVMAPWGRIPVWDPKHVGVKELYTILMCFLINMCMNWLLLTLNVWTSFSWVMSAWINIDVRRCRPWRSGRAWFCSDRFIGLRTPQSRL